MNYQQFSYNKNALKQLYYEIVKRSATDEEEAGDGFTTEWRTDMKQKLKNRQEMNFRYLTYLLVPFLSCCCCCIMKRFEGEGSWYGRNKLSLAKFKIAKEKLNSEVDMKNIIIFQRISKFLQKLQSSRRQRLSVDYFRRYTVQDNEIGRPK